MLYTFTSLQHILTESQTQNLARVKKTHYEKDVLHNHNAAYRP